MILKYCNISSLWDRKLSGQSETSLNADNQFHNAIQFLELYQSANVADRKEKVKDFNNVSVKC